MRVRLSARLPSPLACAVVLVVVIALSGSRPRTIPPGAHPDDRVDDRITGVIGGPLLRTSQGIGAPLHAEGTTVWMWTQHGVVPGQRVVATGRLRTPRGMLSPGSPDRAAIVASRGAEWELTARHVVVVGDADDIATWMWRWAERTQREWASRIGGDRGDGVGGGGGVGGGRAGHDDDDAAAAAVRGIVVGDRGDIPDDLDQRWRIVGIYHVLSVSGLHLAVVAGLVFWLLSRLIAASPLGARASPARWAALPALALAIAYTLVTGAQLATLRALVVVAIIFVAKALDRPLRLVDALGLAAIAILVWRPQDVHDPSFQLSFVAALTLALRPRAAPPLDATRVRRIAHWLARGIATSAWVAITTAPITAFHFQQVAVGGVVGNLVLTPLVELVALPVGLAGVLLDAGPLVAIATSIVEVVDALAGVLARVTPAGAIAIASPVVVVILVVIAIGLAARVRRSRLDAIGWAALCVAWTFARTQPPMGALRVTFLDVGQGDAAIVELPDGAVWLVDAGGIASSRDVAAASAPGRTIERTLAVYGKHAIDLAIISHPHPDHYLGLAALTVPVRELWFADAGASSSTSPAFSEIARGLALRGTRLVTPPLGTLRHAGVDLTVWAPRYQPTAGAREVLAADPVRSTNDNSLIVSVVYAGRTLLFAGDLEAEGEAALVGAGLGDVDVVKVAHHGSRTSSTPGFVAATGAELAVISCGVANEFGFPAPSVVERWRDEGARVERTDRAGTITVTVTAEGTLDVDRFVH